MKNKKENLVYETSLEKGVAYTLCRKHALTLVEHGIEVTLKGTSNQACMLCRGMMRIE